jgi:hypothetical protein
MSSPYIKSNKSCDISCAQISYGICIILLMVLIYIFIVRSCPGEGLNITDNLFSNFIGKPRLFTDQQLKERFMFTPPRLTQIDDRAGHENPMEYDYTKRSQLGEFNGKQRERMINIDKVEKMPDQIASSHVPSISENKLLSLL